MAFKYKFFKGKATEYLFGWSKAITLDNQTLNIILNSRTISDKVNSRKGNSPSLIIKVSNISQWKR